MLTVGEVRQVSKYIVNSEDLFKSQNAKLALRPLELIIPLWGYFSHSWDRTYPVENQNSPQWDPIWPFNAGPPPVDRDIMALIRKPYVFYSPKRPRFGG